jgi:GSH-dependent disulfide-bond oxidoreductase
MHLAVLPVARVTAARKFVRPDCFYEGKMIDLYYWTTPNGHEITIFLEEVNLPYSIKPVNISIGEQFKPEFLKISPNNRIPAIVDNDPADGNGRLSVFESGAILQYLAEKTGKFLPADLRRHTEVMQWLFWQMGELGPMAGQNSHFNSHLPPAEPEACRLLTPQRGLIANGLRYELINMGSFLVR